MMRYQALFVAGFLEVYAFEYYKSDQMVVFDVAAFFNGKGRLNVERRRFPLKLELS